MNAIQAHRHIIDTKRRILKSIAQIKKVTDTTGMTGTIQLHSSSIHPNKWDKVLASISEYKLYRYYVTVTDKLQVALLLD